VEDADEVIDAVRASDETVVMTVFTPPPKTHGVGELLSCTHQYVRHGGMIAGKVSIATLQRRVPVRVRDNSRGGHRTIGSCYFMEIAPNGGINAVFEVFPRLLRGRGLSAKECFMEPVFRPMKVAGHGRNLDLLDAVVTAVDLVENPQVWVRPIELSVSDPRQVRGGVSWGVSDQSRAILERVYDYTQTHPYRARGEHLLLHKAEAAWMKPKPVSAATQPRLAKVRAQLAAAEPAPGSVWKAAPLKVNEPVRLRVVDAMLVAAGREHERAEVPPELRPRPGALLHRRLLHGVSA
jgi:hypothetical protein